MIREEIIGDCVLYNADCLGVLPEIERCEVAQKRSEPVQDQLFPEAAE